MDLGGNSDVEVLAVNVDSNESDIELASVDDLKSVLQGTGVRVAVKEEMVDDTQQQTLLGSYLALAALLLMIAQGALSTADSQEATAYFAYSYRIWSRCEHGLDSNAGFFIQRYW